MCLGKTGPFFSIVVWSVVCVLLFVGGISSDAQILDSTFNSDFDSDDGVYEIEVQEDGKLLVAGYISALGNNVMIGRINTDGSFDNTFNPGTGFNGGIGAISVQTDGKIIVGGRFSKYNGTDADNLIRLNSDGTVDQTFMTGTGIAWLASDFVDRIVIDKTTDKIYVGGQINRYNGVEVSLVVRLNPDGTLDQTFQVPETLGGEVYDMALQSTGKLIIAGRVLKDLKYAVVRLNTDGSIDQTFSLSTTSVEVFSLALQMDDKILVGGDFTNYNGQGLKYLVRLQPDGAIDSGFKPAITGFHSGIGPYYTVRHIKVQGEKILVSGNLYGIAGTFINGLVRLNADGSVHNTFQACKDGGNGVIVLQPLPDGKIVLGGVFVNIFGVAAANKLVRLNVEFNDPPAPVSDFDFIVSGNTVAFIDSSRNAKRYVWNFGDYTTSTVSNPTHVYASSGNFNARLDVFGHCDAKASITRQISILGVQSVFPKVGGNTGRVTLTAVGFGFTLSSQFRLTNGVANIAGSNIVVSPDGKEITATFDMNGKGIGDWDVSVSNASGVKTLAKSFSLVAGISPDIKVEIIGLDRIRRNTFQKFSVNVQNTGNIDAKGIPVYVILEGDSSAQIRTNFEFVKPDEDPIYDASRPYFVFDSIAGKPTQGLIYPIFLDRLGGNNSQELIFEINTQNDLRFSASVGSSFHGSNGIREEIQDDIVDCVKGVLDIALSVLGKNKPGKNECINSVATNSLENWVELNEPAATTKEKLVKVGNIGWNFTKMGVNCFGYQLFNSVSAKSLPTAILKIGLGLLIIATEIDDRLDAGMSLHSCNNLLFDRHSFSLKNIRAVNSLDPNEKIGPSSNSNNTFIRGDSHSTYRILFENISTATAPAQTVTIIDTLDSDALDLATFQLQSFGFGDKALNIPSGLSSYTTTVDLRPANDLIVRVDTKLDKLRGILKWNFISLDPVTLEVTGDPIAGFLPPNVNKGEGEGFISYSLQPKPDLATGAEIRNRAFIYFDNNEPIITNIYSNLIDKAKPTSKVGSVAEIIDNKLTISWSGADPHSGIRSYDIYMARDDEPFQLWLYDVSFTEVNFRAAKDTIYSFYAIAKDFSGNEENAKTAAEASSSIITSIEEEGSRHVVKAYPNPMPGRGNIAFNLRRPQEVTISLSDLLGRRLYLVNDQMFEAGEHTIPLDNEFCSSGVYFCSFESEDSRDFIKIVMHRP